MAAHSALSKMLCGIPSGMPRISFITREHFSNCSAPSFAESTGNSTKITSKLIATRFFIASPSNLMVFKPTCLKIGEVGSLRPLKATLANAGNDNTLLLKDSIKSL
jgi:hypothetical protein